MNPTVLTWRYVPLMVLACVLMTPALPGLGVHSLAGQSTANPPKWWTAEGYQKELGLQPEQSRRLEEIFQAAIPNQRGLKKALDEAEALLERYVEQGDERLATEQIARVVAARADLQTSHSLMLLRMRLVLTLDQYVKLNALQKANPRVPDKSK
jgi:Spy/CpxP family protein refolding chaperone